jgi:transcription initiation factor TFIID subunit TAF12
MKGIFIVFVALCLCACASQPQRTVSVGSTASVNSGATATEGVQRSERVYLDDYERVLIQAPLRNRQTIVLGANRKTQ